MVTVAIGVPGITNDINYTVRQIVEVSDMLSRATFTLNISHFISLRHQSQKILINWHNPLIQSMSIILDSETNLSSTATHRSNIVTQHTWWNYSLKGGDI